MLRVVCIALYTATTGEWRKLPVVEPEAFGSKKDVFDMYGVCFYDYARI